MTSYYNEIDKDCVTVLKHQIQAGNLPDGFVDSRSIEEVQPDEIKEYNEAHFFAGIGGFALGFARAVIPSRATVWTGGFPCQDLSVAGKREGLAGKRSGLYFEFHRLITSNYPECVVLENVPGLLSSNEGRDFAIVIGGLTGIVPEIPEDGWGNAGLFRGPVYNVAYRILDAQFFGVPQRRRRVFIVGSLGDGRAAEILFERESVSGDPPSRREAGKVSATLFASGAGTSRPAGTASETDFLIPVNVFGGNKRKDRPEGGFYVEENSIATKTLDQTGFSPQLSQGGTLIIEQNNFVSTPDMISLRSDPAQPVIFQQNTRDEVRLIGGDGQVAGALSSQAGMKQQNYVMAHGQANAEIVNDGEPSLTNNHEAPILINLSVNPEKPLISFDANRDGLTYNEELAPTLKHGGDGDKAHNAYAKISVTQAQGIRRLTPTECERLQGFPDGWTAGQSDSARYRQLGNAVEVDVAEWIGKRIAVEFG